MTEPSLRPMTLEDVSAVDVLTARTFGHVFTRHGIPAPPQRDAAAARRALGRLSHLVIGDPDGCVVAVDTKGRIVGHALAAMREGTWILSLLIVDPRRHSAGLGRQLVEAVLPDPNVPGLITASPDPRAIALYASLGFRPRPSLGTRGTLRRVPAIPTGVRDGGPHDLELCDELDRLNRGASRRSDLELLLAQGCRMRVVEGEGFSLAAAGQLHTISARSTAVARVLLQDVLASTGAGQEVHVMWLTEAHQWAIEELVRAGIGLSPAGAVCIRPDPERLLPAYLPTGQYL